jgi:hypothetical protein
LASGGRGGGSTGPASSAVVPKAASIWRVNSSPQGLIDLASWPMPGSCHLGLRTFLPDLTGFVGAEAS